MDQRGFAAQTAAAAARTNAEAVDRDARAAAAASRRTERYRAVVAAKTEAMTAALQRVDSRALSSLDSLPPAFQAVVVAALGGVALHTRSLVPSRGSSASRQRSPSPVVHANGDVAAVADGGGVASARSVSVGSSRISPRSHTPSAAPVLPHPFAAATQSSVRRVSPEPDSKPGQRAERTAREWPQRLRRASVQGPGPAPLATGIRGYLAAQGVSVARPAPPSAALQRAVLVDGVLARRTPGAAPSSSAPGIAAAAVSASVHDLAAWTGQGKAWARQPGLSAVVVATVAKGRSRAGTPAPASPSGSPPSSSPTATAAAGAAGSGGEGAFPCGVTARAVASAASAAAAHAAYAAFQQREAGAAGSDDDADDVAAVAEAGGITVAAAAAPSRRTGRWEAVPTNGLTVVCVWCM